jgi:hypothetical protein
VAVALVPVSAPSARSQIPMRAITNPKVISAMLVLTQASNVRSLACSNRGSTTVAS